MGRPSNTEARREEIVEGLLEVMSREGYARASIAAIARAAGLAPGLLHYHFESKQEILLALVTRLSSSVERRAQARLASAGSAPLKRLLAFVDAYVAQGPDADPRAVAAWVVIGAEAGRDAQVRGIYTEATERTLTRLHALVTAALKEAGAPARNARRIAAAILSTVEGAYRISVAAPGVLPDGFAAPALRTMVQALVAAEVQP